MEIYFCNTSLDDLFKVGNDKRVEVDLSIDILIEQEIVLLNMDQWTGWKVLRKQNKKEN